MKQKVSFITSYLILLPEKKIVNWFEDELCIVTTRIELN